MLATPGPTHEKQLLACLEHGKPVLCEKPLTTDVATSLEVVKREAELGKRLIQVGFMRRFDHEYAALKALIDAGELGRPLVMHCAHRNPAVPPNFDSSMIVKDSLVHEVDVTRFLFDEEIISVQIIKPSANPAAPEGLAGSADRDLAHRVRQARRRRGVRHHRVAYEVRTEVVGEKRQRHDRSGRRPGPQERRRAAGAARSRPASRSASAQAYDTEFQRWVDAVRREHRGLHRRPGRVGRLCRRGGVRGRCASHWTPGSRSRSRWSTAIRSRGPDR